MGLWGAIKEAVTGEPSGYFGPLEIRLDDDVDETVGLFKKIMIRGSLGIEASNTDASYVISVLEKNGVGTDAEYRLVISLAESQQEPESRCFQVSGELGVHDSGTAFTDWIQIGAIIPMFLQPSFSGKKTLDVIVRIIDTKKPMKIEHGFRVDGKNKALAIARREFEYKFTEKGYEEASIHKREAQEISLKIGVAVAMADGSLDDSEGEILKNWIQKEIEIYNKNTAEHKELKDIFNKALKDGFSMSKTGNLSLSELTERLAEIGDKKSKYDAIELCFDVMAADGKADTEEMFIIKNVAGTLGLDMDEIEKMREKVTLNFSDNLSSEGGMESLFGFEESWSDEKKRKHLRAEFQKWSNRINVLPEGEERESAQNTLNIIAKLRKKYG